MLEVEGPPHDRTFTAAAIVDGVEVGVGTGRSKKDAEQEAAQQALDAEPDDRLSRDVSLRPGRRPCRPR